MSSPAAVQVPIPMLAETIAAPLLIDPGRPDGPGIEPSIPRMPWPVGVKSSTRKRWTPSTVGDAREKSLARSLQGEDVDLSEIYPVYFGYLEKARRYVEARYGAGARVLAVVALAGALATRTRRLQMGHIVFSNTYRHPALLANAAVTPDIPTAEALLAVWSRRSGVPASLASCHTAEIGARPLTGEERAVGVIDRPAAPELARRRVLVAQELPVEVGEVVEAAEIADRGDRLVHLEGMFDLPDEDDVVREFPLADAADVAEELFAVDEAVDRDDVITGAKRRVVESHRLDVVE